MVDRARGDGGRARAPGVGGGGRRGELEEVVSWSSRRLWGMGVDDIAKKVLLHVLATLT